jgi:hypothetical protein
MTDKQLHQLVDSELKKTGERGATAGEMQFARTRDWFGDYDREMPEEAAKLAKKVARRLTEWRQFLSASRQGKPPTVPDESEAEPPAEPAWWWLAEHELAVQFDPQRREMAALFGLVSEDGEREILDASELPPLFTEIAGSERSEGDWLLFEVPLGWREDAFTSTDGESVYGLASEYRPVWRGFHLEPRVNADGSPGEPTSAERARGQRLFRLAETSQTISDQTGCERAEAVAFLLCGDPLLVPYVDVQRNPRYGGYVIVVRDRRVPAADVAAHYRYWRERFGPLERQPREGPFLVTRFVEEARAVDPSLTWQELYERFNQEHPGRYGSMASFRQTFYLKRPRT